MYKCGPVCSTSTLKWHSTETKRHEKNSHSHKKKMKWIDGCPMPIDQCHSIEKYRRIDVKVQIVRILHFAPVTTIHHMQLKWPLIRTFSFVNYDAKQLTALWHFYSIRIEHELNYYEFSIVIIIIYRDHMWHKTRVTKFDSNTSEDNLPAA